MSILCGVDIIEIDRVRKSLESNPAFRDRIFTVKEIEYCEGKKAAKFQSYAARFAAKEAVSKALGTGISCGICLKDIEVLNNQSGAPHIVLYNGAKEAFKKINGRSISVSLSHCRDYAISYVVIEV